MKKGIIIALVAVIVVALGAFGGYYYYENYVKEEPKEEEKTPEKEQEPEEETVKEWTDEEIQEILSLFFENTGMTNATSTKDMTDSEVFTSIAYMIFFDLDEEEYGVVTGDETGNVYAKSIPLSSIQKLAKQYFNRDNFMYPGDNIFKYDESSQVYRSSTTFGLTGPAPYYVVQNVDRNGTEYTVTLLETYSDDMQAQMPQLQDVTYTVQMHCDNEICYPVSWTEQ